MASSRKKAPERTGQTSREYTVIDQAPTVSVFTIEIIVNTSEASDAIRDVCGIAASYGSGAVVKHIVVAETQSEAAHILSRRAVPYEDLP